METTSISRREALKGAAALGFGAFAAPRIFAAPKSWTPPPDPLIAFGVVSDTHLRIARGGGPDRRHWPHRYLEAAFSFFRDANVDAVVHCGDMADRGVTEEMQFHADVWNRAFPGGRAADGRRVEKLFINGNHDVEGGNYGTGFRLDQFWPDPEERAKRLLSSDMAGNWRRIWGEEHAPLWHKTVKGFHFFGMDWGAKESALAALVDETCAKENLDEGSRPFFFLTHDRTHAAFNAAAKKHPNAFGFWGHWHWSAANWNSVKLVEGCVPTVQCPACYPYFADGRWLGGGDKWIARQPIEGKLAGGRWRQGLLVRVYEDLLAIERREFSSGGSLGAHWLMPLGRKFPHPFALGELQNKIGVPRFAPGAKLKVRIKA